MNDAGTVTGSLAADPAAWAALAVVAAYLVGSLSFAVIVSRAFGLDDPRSYGSGNPGATNVLRSGHKPAALITLVLDGMKGWLPVLLAQRYAAASGLGEAFPALVAVAAFAGHLWPVFFRFKGGKGVATAIGVLFGLHLWLALATLLTWLIVVWFFRYVSFASIVAAVFAAAYQLLLWGTGPQTLAVAVMSALLVWRHAPNIRKLLAGTESRLGRKPAPVGAGPGPAP